MLTSNNIQRTESSNSSSNIWKIEGITINLDEVSINREEFNTELRTIRTNGKGGLGIEQTAGALRMKLKDREDVYVVFDKEICGVAEFDNIRIANQINRLVLAQKYVVFPYAINEEHQVSVVINMAEKKLVVTDSLGISRRNNPNLKELARKLEIENIVDGISNYNRQKNNWECGVHTFFNTLDVVNNRRVNIKADLELDDNLKIVLEHSMRHAVVAKRLQAIQSKNLKEKRKLLKAIESLRDSEGNFRNPNPDDDLKILADALQIEMWGNLDRRGLKDNPGRSRDQELLIQERKIEELIEQYEREHPEDVLGIIILNVLKRGGQYHEVVKYHRNALETGSMGYSHINEEDHALINLTKLGHVFYNLGKYNKAHECYLYTLILLKNITSDNIKNIFLAKLYNNIGNVLHKQYEYKEALANYRKALAIWEKVLEADHPNVANSYNNIGDVLSKQGKYEEALINLRKALAIWEKVLKPDHPDVAASYNNIGGALNAQGQYEGALANYRKALAIWEKVLEADHPNVATSYNNIGDVFSKQGKYEEALINLRKALAVWEKVLGPDHPNLAISYDNICGVLYDQGKYGEALANLRKALAIWKKVLGPDHPNIATSYDNIADVFSKQGKHEEALISLRKALAIREKVLGSDHPDVATSYNNIGGVFSDQGKYEEALANLRKAFAIREKVLGLDHPDVATSYSNIGSVLHAQYKYEEALANCRRALAVWEKVLGPDHPNLATSYDNIGVVLDAQGQYEEALANFRRAFAINKKVLGSHHPDVLYIDRKINILLGKLGRTREASEYTENSNSNQTQTAENNTNINDIRIIEEQGAREEVVETKTIKTSNSSSATHNELMKKFQRELRVSWDDVYIGIAVEQALVGMAGIGTRQTGAQYRPSTTNGVITTTFKLRFTSAEELNQFVSFYNQKFPELIVSEELRSQADSLTTINMDTRILHNYVAKSLGEDVARERAQATSIKVANFRSEQPGCYLS